MIGEYRSGAQTTGADEEWLTRDALRVVDGVVHSSDWTPTDLSAAALLHTDACLRLIKAGRRQDALVHLDAAMRLLGTTLRRDPARTEFARRWHDVVAGLLLAYGADDAAANLRASMNESLRQSAGQRFARDMFAKGLTSEIHAAAAGSLSGPRPKRTSVVPSDARSALRTAAKYFESAVNADPEALDAALHLGRVRLLDGQQADAERWLRVASASRNLAVRYLALTFLGALAEGQGRDVDAETHYRSALDAFRWGQSAPLALSHLLMRTGRERESRETLAKHFTATRGRVVDPLWTYLADPAADLGPTLEQLRAELWQ